MQRETGDTAAAGSGTITKQLGRVISLEFAVAGIYCVLAWLLIQIATGIFPAFDTPAWLLRLTVISLVAGLPVTLVLIWSPILRWVDSHRPAARRPPSQGLTAGEVALSFGDQTAPQIRPWVRYGARLIDIFVGVLFLEIGFAVLIPTFFAEHANICALLSLFLWCFVEALCLSIWGTTPGKSLLGVRINMADGSRPVYHLALSRAVNVWIRGLGLGLPLVGLVTMIVAYEKLTTNGITTWDQSGNFTVSHNRIGSVRGLVAAFLFVTMIALIVWNMV